MNIETQEHVIQQLRILLKRCSFFVCFVVVVFCFCFFKLRWFYCRFSAILDIDESASINMESAYFCFQFYFRFPGIWNIDGSISINMESACFCFQFYFRFPGNLNTDDLMSVGHYNTRRKFWSKPLYKATKPQSNDDK